MYSNVREHPTIQGSAYYFVEITYMYVLFACLSVRVSINPCVCISGSRRQHHHKQEAAPPGGRRQHHQGQETASRRTIYNIQCIMPTKRITQQSCGRHKPKPQNHPAHEVAPRRSDKRHAVGFKQFMLY